MLTTMDFSADDVYQTVIWGGCRWQKMSSRNLSYLKIVGVILPLWPQKLAASREAFMTAKSTRSAEVKNSRVGKAAMAAAEFFSLFFFTPNHVNITYIYISPLNQHRL